MSLLKGMAIVIVTMAAMLGVLVAVDHFAGEDTGVRACELMADRAAAASKSSDSPMTSAEYRTLRKVFEDSQYEDIRESGTAFVDVTWQVSGIKEDDPAILMYAQQIITRYGDLVTACTDVGIQLPLLAELEYSRQKATPGN